MKEVREYIAKNWHKTFRAPSFLRGGYAIPKPYVSPSMDGRYTDLYYWDVYFINLGLMEDGFDEQVENNLDNSDFSTEEFAQEMNMSRSNLHLKLKALTGESALDFIRKIRFKEACRLLKDGRYSISEISDMVGFNTPSYFATCFKKYMGVLPTEYVKNQK